MPPTASRPTTLEEAAAYLTEASSAGGAVKIGDDLDPTGLDRILEHEAGDLTCTVEAGVRLSTLRAALTPARQRLALDPPGDPTVGACLAVSASGPLRHRYGTPRDLVLGATLVLGDGTITSSGGKVVKNVAGYDLAKLVCGSRGTLALIGRVSLRLHPLPETTATLVVATDQPATIVRSLLGSQLQPSALDVLHPGRVAILFEGSAGAVAAQLRTAQGLLGGTATDGTVWEECRERQGLAGGRVRFPPGELATVLAAHAEAVARPGPGVAYVTEPVASAASEGERRTLEAIKQALDPNGTLR